MKILSIILIILISSCNVFREIGDEIKVMVKDGKSGPTVYSNVDCVSSTKQPDTKVETFRYNYNRKKDDFTSVISFHNSYRLDYEDDIIIYKYIRSFLDTVITDYYLNLSLSGGSICIIDGSVVFVLFTDGTVWKKYDRIKISVNKYGNFEYSAYIKLSQSDLDIFTTKTIRKYKLYVFEQDVSVRRAELFKTHVKNIIIVK